MKCGDFERIWNEQLDAREAASPAVELGLEAHASACPECRAVAARYQTLRLALLAMGPPPAEPAGFADRFLDLWGHPEVVASRSPWRPSRLAGPLAAAAVLAIGFRLGWPTAPAPAPRPIASAPRVAAKEIDPRELSNALAGATAATFELARETSSSAARIGREVIDVATADESDSEADPAIETTVDGPPPPAGRTQAGDRSLEGAARHAFGFLLGPTAEDSPPSSDSHHGA